MNVTQRIKESYDKKIADKANTIVYNFGEIKIFWHKGCMGYVYVFSPIKIIGTIGWDTSETLVIWGGETVFHITQGEWIDDNVRVYRPDVDGWIEKLEHTYLLAKQKLDDREAKKLQKNYGVLSLTNKEVDSQ